MASSYQSLCLYFQRSLTEQQRTSLTADLKALNLSKYLQEVVSRVY